jgi:hypothetical protein
VWNYAGQSEDCEPRGGHYSVTCYVRRFDSAEPVSFGELFGAPAGAAYVKAIPKKAHDDNGEACGEAGGGGDKDWRIGRGAGRWTAYMSQSVGNFGCSVDAPIRFSLPRSITGESAAPFDWKGFRAIEKELQDGYVSPTRDLAIVTTKTEMKFYEVQEKAPGKMLLTLPAHDVVTVQWATGTHVQDWTTQLGKIAGQTLPEPVVRVKAAAK